MFPWLQHFAVLVPVDVVKRGDEISRRVASVAQVAVE
jgi:hypothetical protein